MRLRYSPEALADLERIQAYIRDDLKNPKAAVRISRLILDNYAQLKTFPQMGVDLSAAAGFETDLRMLVCEHYVALYRREDGVISVARVLHAKQDFFRFLLPRGDQ